MFTTSRQSKVAGNSSTLQIRLQMIGCQAAGKTVSTLMLVYKFFESYLNDLRISATDPAAYNKLRDELFNRLAGFTERPMDPTLVSRGLNAIVKSGNRSVFNLSITDPVGHVLTGVTDASEARLRQQHTEYCKDLREANVLCVFLPAVPGDASAQDRMRFDRNIRTTSAHLDHALEQRSADDKVSIVITGTKIDVLGNSPEEVRESLTEDDVRECFSDLVRLIRTSDKVAHAAIIPISACGFGTMRLLNGSRRSLDDRDTANGRESIPRDFIGEEAPYALRQEAMPEPYNLKALLAWCLWSGASPQLVDPQMQGLPQLADAICQLEQILKSADSWIVPIT